MADEEKIETPADRIRAAIAGRNPKGYTEVRCADVVAVAQSVPAGQLAGDVAAIAAGAARAIRETSIEPHEARAHQTTGHLAALLEAAGAHVNAQ